jgi:hypothetical protein
MSAVLARIWHGRSLGYEPHDTGLRRAACSLAPWLAGVVVLLASRSADLRLGRSAQSQRVSCTNPCTPWHGVRSSPRSGTLRATPGSLGRQGSARRAEPKRALAPPEVPGVGLCLPGRGHDLPLPISDGGPGCGQRPAKADGLQRVVEYSHTHWSWKGSGGRTDVLLCSSRAGRGKVLRELQRNPCSA